MVLFLLDVVLKSIKESEIVNGLLIKNALCDWASHSARFMILVVSLLTTLIVFPSSVLSQALNSKVENSQELSSWPQTVISQKGIYWLTLFPASGEIPMRRLHFWHLHIENSLGAPVLGAHVQIDGGMPSHGHGLPSVPRVRELPGEGNYMIEGMKFTMGGEWQLRLVIIHKQADRANILFTLNP